MSKGSALKVGLDSVRKKEKELFIKILECQKLAKDLSYIVEYDIPNPLEEIIDKLQDCVYSYLYDKFIVESKYGDIIGIKD